MAEQRKLSAEDQARVDEYLASGYNRTERKPFRPLRLLVILIFIVSSLTIAAWFLVHQVAGIKG